MRRGGGFAMTAKTPEGQGQGHREQGRGQLAPGNLGGRLAGGLGVVFRGSMRGGVRHRGKVLVLAATLVFAAIVCAMLVIVIVVIGAGKILREAIAVRKTFRAKFGRRGRVEFGGGGAEIRENGLLLNLTFAQSSQIVGYGFFFVESDLAGVGAHETFVEDAAGKLVEVFVLEGAQHASADFGGVGDGIEREAALLALFAKFFSKRSHGRLRRAESSFRPTRIIIGEGGGRCQKRMGCDETDVRWPEVTSPDSGRAGRVWQGES